MSPVQPGSAQSDAADAEAIRAWLEALANGSYDEGAFLLAVQQRFKSNSEASWEVLSHLDQYYRRGRIAPETFRNIKRALAESALGLANPDETHGIPVAREVVTPREDTQSLDTIGEPKPGSVLRRRYRLEAMLGQGHAGPVFQAVDEYRLESPGGQRVAIKILQPAVVRRAELLAEARREFQVLQLLSHPNILRVFEFDRDEQLVFFTMELLNGATLSRVLQARKLAPLPRVQALAAVRDIGAALAYAHSRGAIHGDLSPRNIFVTAQGELRLRGFPGAYHESSQPLAVSGYASCEILEGARADTRDDVFSLACLAYLLISGEHPLGNKTAVEARDSRLLVQRPAQTSNRQWRALRAGLRWDRDSRPADMRQWLIDLDLRGAAARLPSLSDLLEAPHSKEAKPRWVLRAALGAVLILAGAFWYVSQRGILPRITSNNTAASSRTSIAPATVPDAVPDASPPAAPPTVAPTPAPAAARPPTPTAAPAAVPPAIKTTTASIASPPAAAPSVTATSDAPPGQAPATAAHSTKVELASDTVDVPAGEPAALVPVHRRGSLRGETTFTWWTESGTAKPGTDFSAIMPQVAHVPDGKANLILSIPLSSAPHTQAKSFYVVIDQTEGGAALGARTLTMITLQPPE